MPEPGELIGPYRLVSQLGKGAMGEVWRARDERLDRYVALKILPPDSSGDLERRARMVREAKAAAQIKHPNVVTLFDIFEHEGEDLLVMELVEGRTLSEALRKDGPPTLELALRWIEGIADALVAAHARRILHRDIKSANIMVSGNDVKVLDFGLAKLRDEHVKTQPPAPRPNITDQKIALDATMPSQPSSPGRSDVSLAQTLTSSGTPSVGLDVDSYRTHAGQLLGTPLYMAPEQIEGQEPDERSEVFSLGVLAHEILVGKPPYTATSMDELFRQISKDEPPDLPAIPDSIQDIVFRALAKKPAARYQTMKELRDAVGAERRRRFSPRSKRWPLLLAGVVLLAIGSVTAYLLTRTPAVPDARPGDDLVKRALEEYDVFYNDKALSSLRTALARIPEHPTANAYILLFDGSDSDRARALAIAPRARLATDEQSRERTLLDAAVAFSERGPVAARTVLSKPLGDDRELAFWAAEFDYRSGNFKAARDAYAALLAQPQQAFRGRIYDHYSSVLLYLDEPDEALRVGTLYRDAFPGEADAVAVYATTLAAVGDYTKAVAAAEDALALSEGEDTLAGLAKVLALSGDRVRAKDLYRRSLDKAGPSRRPVRRAALALLHYIDGELDLARATVAPCLVRTKQADPAGKAGSDATARERGACLFVAGLVDPSAAETIASDLDALAAEATDLRPAYGSPRSLAILLRARARFFGGGCLVAPEPDPRADHGERSPLTTYDIPLDFYAAYHIPFFATYAPCEKAAQLAATGDRPGARKLLTSIADRGKNRTWLLTAAKRFE